MADTAAPPPLRDPGERGTLTIADRVVERIALRAAGEIPGVTRSGGRAESVVGRRYPKVDARIAGDRVRVGVEVAVLWPSPLPATTAAVRSAVAERVESLSGLHVDAVDVTAARVVPPEQDEERRVL